MSQMQIPESVVKEWEDASGYDEGTSQMVAYLQGRQDEYRKQVAGIERLKGLLQQQYVNGFLDLGFTEEELHSNWLSFKSKHNI